jgi:hypothetical protein
MNGPLQFPVLPEGNMSHSHEDKGILCFRFKIESKMVQAINFGTKVENVEGLEGEVDTGRKGSLTSKCHSKLKGAVKQKATINQLVIFLYKTKGMMPPNQQIYSSLLSGKNLDYYGGKMWENRSKTCTTYTKFGCCYRQQM